jgi:hypothetical protein
MRTLKLFMLINITALMLASCSSSYYVAERPAAYVYTRPAPPFAGAIWIGPEYYWSGGRYVVRPGYWTRPRSNYSYHPGYWNHNSHGHTWVRGGWRPAR